jgi:hypothetical protein
MLHIVYYLLYIEDGIQNAILNAEMIIKAGARLIQKNEFDSIFWFFCLDRIRLDWIKLGEFLLFYLNNV